MRRMACGVAALGMALASPVGAMQPAQSAVTEAPAQALQTPADSHAAAGKGAKAGRTQMKCHVNADGTLSDCAIIYECPVGAGFGKAALEAARKFKMRPKTVDDKPVAGGTVIVPMVWKLDGVSEPPPECQSPPASITPSSASAPPPRAVDNPDWVREPTGDDLARLYPREAAKRRQEGHTTMRCKVRKDGTLADCTITEETPPGLGFGSAALASVKYFKMTPVTPGGQPVEGGVVIIPMGWRLGE